MPTDLYDVGQVLEKTLYANRDLPVFDGYPTATYTPKQVGVVKAGNPAGIVYSWVDADPSNRRDNIWWVFYPATANGSYYMMPHGVGFYDVSTLREQGVITVDEQKEQEEEANKEWYEKIVDKALPWVVGAVLGAALIRGAISRVKL